MLETFESSSAAERLHAVHAFIERVPVATEILIVGASRDAANDVVRRITLELGTNIRTSPRELHAARRAPCRCGNGAPWRPPQRSAQRRSRRGRHCRRYTKGRPRTSRPSPVPWDLLRALKQPLAQSGRHGHGIRDAVTRVRSATNSDRRVSLSRLIRAH
jgi:hypothetical protein